MMTVHESVRVRMAPSPTGLFNLGGARTALFNWLFAKKHGGKFIVRIEDTDIQRSKREYEENILESLQWLGLEWDEGPQYADERGSLNAQMNADTISVNQCSNQRKSAYRGDYGPYRQSERLDIYEEYLKKLLSEKKAYFCFCSKEQLDAEKQAMQAQGLASKYSGHCASLGEEEAEQKRKKGEKSVIRLRIPQAEVEFHDLIRGKIKFDASLMGDIVIARDLQSPLYGFAVVIDDALMKISHVLRGEEHISNTPGQILLQKALGFTEPHYAHLPLILGKDRKKLSKRYMDTSLFEYKKQGYVPEALVNFIAFLGWHPKDEKEIFTLDELVKEFDLKRVQKAGAVFNPEKLDWLNGQYIKRLTIEELIARLEPFLLEKNIAASEEFLKKIVEAERDRMKTLKDFFVLTDFFFKLPDYEANLLVWKQEPVSNIKTILEKAFGIIKNIGAENFERVQLFASLDDLVNEYGRGAVFWPLRVAVSGKSASPDPLVIMEILGKDETVRRIGIAKDKIESLIA
ncbi:MAG: glutamate--tRNA ligase [Candidatus Liptonbacteria bacterium]|nr:glutamate--tRNA ligase [Candidatus Liptonbacteria bacterium]